MPPMHHQSQAPYTYVQQPRLEEKTVLRKKFSWKHYPELERFLIANREDYLKHSNMNYTAEQKTYNNWLTERLLEVASMNNYVFDADDFNFVAIRDRIRCYYKSYVQTARKRGLKLPDKGKTVSRTVTTKTSVASTPSKGTDVSDAAKSAAVTPEKEVPASYSVEGETPKGEDGGRESDQETKIKRVKSEDTSS